MNNTRYFDLAEDCVGAAAGGKLLKEIRTEYVNEARFGEELTLRWNGDDGTVFLSGESSKPVFRMTLRYE
jgi:acyl-ACP thioesterase